MTFLWLVAWLLNGTPGVVMLGPWNNWGTALAVCFAIDAISNVSVKAVRIRRP